MNSRQLTIPVNGTVMPAYLSSPVEGSGAHPAVIVLHEVFGFNPEARRIADLLGGIGYHALAIDYYHRLGQGIDEPYTDAGSLRAFANASRVSESEMAGDVRAAAQWLASQSFVKDGKIAVWGFGFGATAAFVAAQLRELSGAICFYPGNAVAGLPSGEPAPLESASRINVPVLVVFGDRDYYVSRHDMQRLNAELKHAGKDVRLQMYPDVGHSFFRHGRPEAVVENHKYSDEAIAHAVADSWDLTQAFLREIFTKASARSAASGDIRTQHTPVSRG